VRGGRIAWVQWGTDRMPWDGTQLWVADYRVGLLSSPVRIAGGDDESVLEPQWDPVGGLTFVSDRSGRWNLCRWDGESVVPLVSVDADLAAVPWELGYSSYVHLRGGRIAMTVHDGPFQSLAVVDRAGRLDRVDLPFTSIKPYLDAAEDQVVAIAAAPAGAAQVISIDLSGAPSWQSLTPAPQLATDAVLPEPLVVDGPAGRLHALVYRPAGCGGAWRAPTVVRAHPGPTASMGTKLDAHVQFLCRNGFAVVDVDYRGSSGYSRAFRQSLYGRWGTADVEDCVALAAHLVSAGHTPAGQVFIAGASAGGYTALQAICQSDLFSGAVARSAIIDPARWQAVVPRWQQAHAAQLAGPAGAVRAAAIRRPVLFIHGVADHVAPLQDVLELAGAMTTQDRPHQLLALGAAGHEFGSDDDNSRASRTELAFYLDLLS
jgi:dipeptidyl aminopeptidase/acylaminoacyl peptidase